MPLNAALYSSITPQPVIFELEYNGKRIVLIEGNTNYDMKKFDADILFLSKLKRDYNYKVLDSLSDRGTLICKKCRDFIGEDKKMNNVLDIETDGMIKLDIDSLGITISKHISR